MKIPITNLLWNEEEFNYLDNFITSLENKPDIELKEMLKLFPPNKWKEKKYNYQKYCYIEEELNDRRFDREHPEL